jgi:hypothetical protein
MMINDYVFYQFIASVIIFELVSKTKSKTKFFHKSNGFIIYN